MLYATSLAEISSNARIKKYPDTDLLQVANAPVFRMPGFEPRERAYAVPAKGNACDPERALDVSRARAKAAVRDIALCNHFAYFFTWTLSPEKIDRYDREAVKKRVCQGIFLCLCAGTAQRRRNSFPWLVQPWYSEDSTRRGCAHRNASRR